VFMTPGFCH